MCFRNGAAGSEAPRDAGEPVSASAKGRGTLVAQGSGIQARLDETDGEDTLDEFRALLIDGDGECGSGCRGYETKDEQDLSTESRIA